MDAGATDHRDNRSEEPKQCDPCIPLESLENPKMDAESSEEHADAEPSEEHAKGKISAEQQIYERNEPTRDMMEHEQDSLYQQFSS